MDFSANAEKSIRTAPQIRSQGACGAFYWGNCKPIAGSHAVETMGWISSYLSRRPLPCSGGGVGGAEPSAASGGCSEAEHPQRSKKSSKRAARRFFRAPQGGGGRCACGYLGSVSVRSTDDALASFVSSTASDRKGFVKGESVPLDPLLPPFGGAKGGPRRAGVQVMPLQKAPRRRRRLQTGPHRSGGQTTVIMV